MSLLVRISLCASMLVCWSTVAAFADEKVDNPEYKHWAQFKPGCFSRMGVTSVIDGVRIKTVITTTLKKATPNKVVIETKIVTTTEGGKDNASVTKEQIPAKIEREKVKIEPKEVGRLPDGREVLDLKRGKEEIEINGKKIAADWIETKIKNKDRTTVSKTWVSEDIPGRVVKKVIDGDGGMPTHHEQSLEGFRAEKADDVDKEEAKDQRTKPEVGTKDKETKKTEEGKGERKDKKKDKTDKKDK